MTAARVRKVRLTDKWACVVFQRGKAVECRHFATWGEAFGYAREVTR